VTLRRLDQGRLVSELQRDLRAVGGHLVVDGCFGPETQTAVKMYQASCGLEADGIAGPRTFASLAADLEARNVVGLQFFRGRLGFIVAHEGFRSRPYWDTGRHSGVTLSYGLDLGHQSVQGAQRILRDVLGPGQIKMLEPAVGLKGPDAGALCDGVGIGSIELTRSQAARILARAAPAYWGRVEAACPEILRPQVPDAVHTAVLDLAYNRGPAPVRPLRSLIVERNWPALASVIGSMQQDHPLEGVRARRRAEADLLA